MKTLSSVSVFRQFLLPFLSPSRTFWMITVRHLSPSLSAASAEPTEHPDQAGISVSGHKIWGSLIRTF